MRRSLAIMASLWLLILCGCPKGNDAPKKWNILLVTFDTTRADRIGCYGNTSIQTPTLDKLAEEGIRFANAMSTNPITAPSHTTIHTGRFPPAHGVRDNGLYKLGEAQVTLAEILKEQGYQTAAAIGAFPLASMFGLDQGFDLYNDHLTGAYENYQGERTIPKDRLFFDERKAAQVNEAIFPWLDDHAQDPFFLWVHYFDPHQPFEPEPPYNHQYADDLYNGEIAYADACLGYLLRDLDRKGVLDNTLVIMTADHGEGLGEHNELTHAVLAYNSTLHVPLIIRPPQGNAPAGKVIEHRVGTIDIVPTVLDLLNISWPKGDRNVYGLTTASLQGQSLVPLWQGKEPAPRLLYSENLSPALTHGWGELRALFDGDLKYIHGPRRELFNLVSDPDELNNLVTAQPEEAAALRFKLVDFLQKNALDGVSTTEAISEEVREQLAALGYLRMNDGGGETTGETLREGGIAPQDRVRDINDMSSAKHLLFKGQFAEALPIMERLIEAAPDSPVYQELYGSALANLGRVDEAWDLLLTMRQTGKVSEGFLLAITTQRFEQGETQESLELLEAYVEGRPAAKPAWVLAGLYLKLGETTRAKTMLDKALELEPHFTLARIDLAIYFSNNNQPELAHQHFQTSLENDPFNPKAHYNYGTFLVQSGLLERGYSQFQRAVDLAPKYLKAHLGLLALDVAESRLDKARETLKKMRDIAPQSQEIKTAEELLEAPDE